MKAEYEIYDIIFNLLDNDPTFDEEKCHKVALSVSRACKYHRLSDKESAAEIVMDAHMDGLIVYKFTSWVNYSQFMERGVLTTRGQIPKVFCASLECSIPYFQFVGKANDNFDFEDYDACSGGDAEYSLRREAKLDLIDQIAFDFEKNRKENGK